MFEEDTPRQALDFARYATMTNESTFWWIDLPQDSDSSDPFTPRCQKCGSYAVAVRRSGRELVIGCKDCGRSVSHHSREKAWQFFLRPLMSERDLDRVSKAYAQAAIDERRARQHAEDEPNV